MKKAFTLIELLVVVLIIGILSAIALPQYQKTVAKSRYLQAKILATALAQAQQNYYLANGSFIPDISALDIDMPTPTSRHTTSTRDTYVYSWGWCEIEYGNTSCYINEPTRIGYAIYPSNNTAWENFAGKKLCDASKTDSLANSICQQETGLKDPSGTQGDQNIYFFN